jgi:phage terminase large subunit-like protein
MPPSPTRAERNIAWIEAHCRVPEGKFVGQPLKVAPFMVDDFKAIYDNPHGTRRAIITRGRKNAKTTEAAMILLLHLCSHEARRNSSLYSDAQSRDQAAILHGLAAKIVRMSPTLNAVVVIRDTAKELLCPELGTFYKALSADAPTAFGLSPVLNVHDELGQVKGPRSPLYEAMETATAAQENPLSVIISTQAPTDADLLSKLIDDAKTGADPRTVLRLQSADPDADPFDPETIKQANPALDLFMNRREVLDMAEGARRMPSREAEYRNLILNQRVERFNPFVSKSVWQACGGPVIESFKGLPVYGGLDLSSTTDLTALALIAPHKQVWHVKPTFWLPEEGLRERARQDVVEYDVWAAKCVACVLSKATTCDHQEKSLATTPGKSVDYEFVANHLRGLFDDLDIRKVGFDRWAWVHFRPWLLKAGFSEREIELKFVQFGQGYQSMSPALRDLETDLLNERIAHGNHPVLRMCAANAVVHPDPAGNRKLDKVRSRGRIDGMVALTMARGVAATEALQRDDAAFAQDDIAAMFEAA